MVRLSRLVLVAAVAAVLLYSLAFRSCGEDNRRPIRVEENRVVITNMTDDEWTGVEVWVDRWYRAQAPALAPGQRLDIPLRVFVAGYGQHFDPARRAPTGIEVNARAPDGSAVRLTWGEGRKGQ